MFVKQEPEESTRLPFALADTSGRPPPFRQIAAWFVTGLLTTLNLES